MRIGRLVEIPGKCICFRIKPIQPSIAKSSFPKWATRPYPEYALSILINDSNFIVTEAIWISRIMFVSGKSTSPTIHTI